MVSIKRETELLLKNAKIMKRTQLINSLKRYRGWELARMANFFGYNCNENVSKTVALQLVLQHLLTNSADYKLSV